MRVSVPKVNAKFEPRSSVTQMPMCAQLDLSVFVVYKAETLL